MRLAFDIETDGFLEELTKIHCVHTIDLDSGESRGFVPDTIEDGIRYLQQAEELIGHNIIKFDIPAIEKVTGMDFSRIKQTDTLNLSRLVFPQIKDQFDWPLIRHQQKTGQKEFPKNLIGKHSLKAWGYRLHEYKGDFEGPWDTWTQEMDDYCAQDVIVTEMVYNRLMKEEPSQQSVWIEMEFQKVIHKMEQHGIHFDLELAHRLYSELAEKKQEAFAELSRVFPPIYISKGEFTPKRNNKTRGYTEGVPFTKIELQEFNPGSEDQIVNRFIRKYKWEPEEFSKKTGKPTASDDVLKTLDYYEVPYLQEFRMVSKRLSILDGWLRAVTKDGKIHGGLITNGTVTGRGTHKVIANVPRVKTAYGKEFRKLFVAGEGYSLVGCDMAGAQLRILGHYLAKWDKGAYTQTVLDDPHTTLQNLIGLESREIAKTLIYSFIFGGQENRIGSIVGGGAKAGKATIIKLYKKMPAIKNLKSVVQKRVKNSEDIKGLDGRRLFIRSQHSALNFLIQGAEAVIMKVATIILHNKCIEQGWKFGKDWALVIHYHDEFQCYARRGIEEQLSNIMKDSIKEAGEFFNLKCPMKGDAKIGKNWAETH